MYQFKPVTDRVWKYRERIRERVLVCDNDRARIVTEAYKKYGNALPIIKKALAHHEYCEKCACFIGEDELIVGSKGNDLFANPQYPEWGFHDWFIEPIREGKWDLDENGFWHNPADEPVHQTVSEADVRYLEEIRTFWKDRTCGIMAKAWKPDFYEELERLEVSSYRPGGMGLIEIPLGHLVAGYKKIIRKGYKAIREEAQGWLDRHYDNLQGEDVRKYTFYKAAAISADAAMILCRRYGDACAQKAAQCNDTKRKAELETMAENLQWIAENPAGILHRRNRESFRRLRPLRSVHLAVSEA